MAGFNKGGMGGAGMQNLMKQAQKMQSMTDLSISIPSMIFFAFIYTTTASPPAVPR